MHFRRKNLTKNKMLVGVIGSTFMLVSILGTIPSHAAKNNLSKQVDSSLATPEVAFLLSEDKNNKILTKYENATSLTDSQLVELLKAVGFKGKALKTAWAVAKAESNGRPFAFNGNTKTGDSSFGIFQINMLGTLGPDRRDKYDLDFNAYLFNPVMNAQIVYRMTKAGTDWSSWSSYNKGAIYKWLNKFPEN
jgi:Lysozyme like domain